MKIVLFPFKIILFSVVYFYKWFISPMLPKVCKYFPSCSTYFLNSIKEFGPFKGFIIGSKRILRCSPFCHQHGYDPVPINIKGDSRWLL